MSRASHILCTQAAAAIAAADAPGKGKEIAEALYDKAWNDALEAIEKACNTRAYTVDDVYNLLKDMRRGTK